MNVRIKYCRPCGYLERAERLAEKLRCATAANVELVPGNFGVFKIWVNGELVFDKRQTRGILGKLGFGDVPSDEELVDRVQNLIRHTPG